MKRVVALVGRPNVGKSTLYNRLTRSRDALVADEPGMTRDRRYGHAMLDDQECILIDTGGISGEQGIDELIAEQARQAIAESDAVVFLVDGREGLVAADESIARELHQSGKNVFIAVNKVEGMQQEVVAAEFYGLGFEKVYSCSAAHGDGVMSMFEEVLESLPASDDLAEEELPPGPKIAIIGRPNVGKSTLVNRLLGEERVLAFDMPGTTRDSIFIPFERNGLSYTLIDTAGVRRKSRVNDKIEKFSIVKTLQAIESANVVVLVLDAQQGISNQDASLLGYIIEAGKALLIAINKWDNLSQEKKDLARKELDRKLNFVPYASVHFISALHGTGVGKLMEVASNAYESAKRKFSTNELTRILEDAVRAHAPPSIGGRRIKLRYAHQGGQNPPVIVIHGNQTESIPDSYRRYLINIFREVMNIQGTPMRIEFKSGENPYKGKKNTLTPRQINKRKRLMKHLKSKR